MNNNYTHIALVLDRSGSMNSIASDVIGSTNIFLDDQAKVDGKATISIYKFDTEFEPICENEELTSSSTRLNASNYIPRGWTALLDAIGFTIVKTGQFLNDMPEEERPGVVFIVIQTDGQENASKEYTKDKIKEMIEHQEKTYDWKFVYLGANQDAIKEGASMGTNSVRSMTFSATSLGYNTMISGCSADISDYRLYFSNIDSSEVAKDFEISSKTREDVEGTI